MTQKYGLALALFRDTSLVHWPVAYDLKHDIERELGMPVEQFMAMGHVCSALGNFLYRTRQFLAR